MNNTGDIGKKKIVSTRIINAGNDYFPENRRAFLEKGMLFAMRKEILLIRDGTKTAESCTRIALQCPKK